MSLRSRAWRLMDTVVRAAPTRGVNPWATTGTGDICFEPDYQTLIELLAVPVALDARSQTHVPAMALDVWIAFELRRAGFDRDAVWPRQEHPRVLPREIATLLRSLKGPLRDDLAAVVATGIGLGGAVGSSANLLGKNYVKQVDVVMSSWDTGPEIMISTKRMDSSFAKNAANRVEESYGDAKNLRLRHPRSALGYAYALNAHAFVSESDKADWMVDLLIKLGREEDAYDAVMLIVPDYSDAAPPPIDEDIDEPEEDPFATPGAAEDPDLEPALLGLADIEPPPGGDGGGGKASQSEGQSEGEGDEDRLARTPRVVLRRDLVPPEVDPGRFFEVVITKVFDNSPVNYHREARGLRTNPRPGPRGAAL
jgi:hypothetical protein